MLSATVIMAFTVTSIHAQQPVAKIGYFMDNAPSKHFLNPALAPVRGYFSLPAVGNFNVGLNSNLAVNNFTTFANPNATEAEFLAGLSANNYINSNLRMGVLGIGTYIGRHFISFDLGTRINFETNVPYDFFRAVKQGFEGDDIHYDIQNMSLSTEVIGEAALGGSFEIIEGLRIGAKAKLLAGGLKMAADLNRFKVDLTSDMFHIQTDADLSVYGAGLGFETDNDTIVNLAFNTPNQLAGMGVAFDLGASYTIISSKLLTLNVSAGVIDLGSIKWSKNAGNVANAGGNYTITQDDIIAGYMAGGTVPDEEPDITAQMTKMLKFVVKDDAGVDLPEPLTATINAGAEVGVLDNRISLGVLYSQRMHPVNPSSEITAMLNLKPIPMLSLSGSYALKKVEVPTLGSLGTLPTFGVGLGLNLFIANIFVACDYVPLDYMNAAANTHIQAGVSIALGKMKDRQ